MKKLTFIFGVCLCFAGANFAATIYKCGTSFSDKPCTQGPTTTTKLWGAAPVRSDPVPDLEAITAACVKWIKKAANWKDADSLKISPLTSMGMTFIGEGKQALAVYAYYTDINGKNSYGAYTGPKSAICYVNQQKTKVIGGRLPK